MATQPTQYAMALASIERAEDNSMGDHPRYPYVWVTLCVAAVRALLALVDAIESHEAAVIDALPMAGKGN